MNLREDSMPADSMDHLARKLAATYPLKLVGKALNSSWRRLRTASFSFLEMNRDTKNTLVVASSPRSGSTWLAELLGHSQHCRLIFEPFEPRLTGTTNPKLSHVRPGMFLSADSANREAEEILNRVLSGRVRFKFHDDPWATERVNKSFFPTSRLIKDNTITNLLPRISQRYPEVSIIYLLRHPIACAWSMTRMGWVGWGLLDVDPSLRSDLIDEYFLLHRETIMRQAFITNINRWCLENTIPLRTLCRESVHIVFYEDLVQEPARELDRIQRFLHEHSHGSWREWSPKSTVLWRPSATAFYGDLSTPPPEWATRAVRWREELSQEWVGCALRRIRAFGVDGIYGEQIRPLIPAQEVLGKGTSAEP